MTISRRIQQQLFTSSSSPDQGELIRLPPTLLAQVISTTTQEATTRSDTTTTATTTTTAGRSTTAAGIQASPQPRPRRTNLWTIEEHERFLSGLEMFRHGPWKNIAAIVGTKTTRQTMTHAQKYRQKIERRQRVNEAMANVAATYPRVARSLGQPVIDTPMTTTPNVGRYLDGSTSHATPRQLGEFIHSGDISPLGGVAQRHDAKAHPGGPNPRPHLPQI